MLSAHTPPVVSLNSYLAFVLRKWWLFVVALAAAILLGLVYLAHTQPLYTVTMVVAPVETENEAAGNVGALSSLLKSANSSTDAIGTYRDLIMTPFFAGRLIQKHHVLPLLYQDAWDPNTQSWREPTGLLYRLKKQVFSWIGRPAWVPPSANSLASLLEEQLEIKPSTEDAFMTLRLLTADVSGGQHLLTLIHAEADTIMRTREVRNTEARIRYLQKGLRKTRSVERQRAMLQLLTMYENKLVTIDNDLPYAVEIIAPPSASDVPTHPSPFKVLLLLIVVSMTGVGLLTWLLYLQSLDQVLASSEDMM